MAAVAKPRITRDKLKCGDLIFFGPKGPNSSVNSIYHAGLYLGRGWFIHSTGSSDGVTLAVAQHLQLLQVDVRLGPAGAQGRRSSSCPTPSPSPSPSPSGAPSAAPAQDASPSPAAPARPRRLRRRGRPPPRRRRPSSDRRRGRQRPATRRRSADARHATRARPPAARVLAAAPCADGSLCRARRRRRRRARAAQRVAVTGRRRLSRLGRHLGSAHVGVRRDRRRGARPVRAAGRLGRTGHRPARRPPGRTARSRFDVAPSVSTDYQVRYPAGAAVADGAGRRPRDRAAACHVLVADRPVAGRDRAPARHRRSRARRRRDGPHRAQGRRRVAAASDHHAGRHVALRAPLDARRSTATTGSGRASRRTRSTTTARPRRGSSSSTGRTRTTCRCATRTTS